MALHARGITHQGDGALVVRDTGTDLNVNNQGMRASTCGRR